ncbi:MAG: hypothetical protein WAK51_01920 [Opitutaceae bacterium]
MNPPSHPKARNPGPPWGYRFLGLCDRLLPEPVYRPLRAAGTWIALPMMPLQRQRSRAYLRAALNREPRIADVFRHFFAVCESLVLRLRVANGRPHRCVLAPGTEDFGRWLSSDRPALLGTFHIGNSDLAGYLLAEQGRRTMHLIRMRVGNSHDTDVLAARFGDRLRFVWVNEPSEMLFALKEAGGGAGTLALQCDRPQHSSRSEYFEFLGARRSFPFTIYHLSRIFERPVFLAFGAPSGHDQSTIFASPAFEPAPGEPVDAALARARGHFQSFLFAVESYLRSHPYQWLNFLPL